MKRNRVTVALALTLTSLVCTASCVETSETDVSGAARSVEMPNDNIRDVGAGSGGSTAVGESSSGLGAWRAKDMCLAVADAGVDAREAFCRSFWVPPVLKQSCWAHVPESSASWSGWCYWYF
ncbi:MAG: hypothetical protein QM820_38860 [Minicystis sp.]